MKTNNEYTEQFSKNRALELHQCNNETNSQQAKLHDSLATLQTRVSSNATPVNPPSLYKSVPKAAGRSPRRTPPSVHGASDEALRVQREEFQPTVRDRRQVTATLALGSSASYADNPATDDSKWE